MRQEAGIILLAVAIALAGCLGGAPATADTPTADDLDAAEHEDPTDDAAPPNETREDGEAPASNATASTAGETPPVDGALPCLGANDTAVVFTRTVTLATTTEEDEAFHLSSACPLVALLGVQSLHGQLEARLVGPGDHLLLHARMVAATDVPFGVGHYATPDPDPAPAGPYVVEWTVRGSAEFVIGLESPHNQVYNATA